MHTLRRLAHPLQLSLGLAALLAPLVVAPPPAMAAQPKASTAAPSSASTKKPAVKAPAKPVPLPTHIESDGGVSVEPIPPSLKPIYRPYTCGMRTPEFHLDGAAYESLLRTLASSALYPPQPWQSDVAIRLEVRKLLKQAGESSAALDRIKLGPGYASRIIDTYGPHVSPNLLWYAIMRGTVDGMGDPNGAFLLASEQRSRLVGMRGSGGAGFSLQVNAEKALLVSEVIPKTPAARAGLQGGDELIAVQGAPCVGWTPDDVAQRILGPVNSPLHLKIRRRGTEQSVRMMRQLFRAEPATFSARTGGIMYIRIREISPRLVASLVDFLRHPGDAPASRLVLDLRGVSGTNNPSGIALASTFATRGQVLCTMLSSKRSIGTLRAEIESFPGKRIAVLVDERTGGAAEIAALLLRDSAYAHLFGRRTRGSGTELSTYTLPDRSVAWFSSARYHTPRSPFFDRVGLAPDKIVAATDHPYGSDGDPTLTEAMLWVNAVDPLMVPRI